MLISLARGFARTVHPYALSQYQYTYEHGFLIRGLPGELARHACGSSSDCLLSLVEKVGTCSVIAFALAVWLVVQLQSRWSPAANLTLAAFASGPLCVQIGAGRGYHDALTLALGVASYHAFVRRRFVTSVVLFGVALLVHELVAIYILPLFALRLALSVKERGLLLRAAVVVVLAAGSVAVVKLGHANREQQRDIEHRLGATAGSLGRGWRQYRSAGMAAAKTDPERGNGVQQSALRRTPFGRYVAPLVFGLVLVFALLAAQRALLLFPLYAALLLAPAAVLFVAWDVERLLSLAGLTALFVCLTAEERTGVRRAPIYALVATLGLVTLGLKTHYNVASRYAYEGTLFGPARRHKR